MSRASFCTKKEASTCDNLPEEIVVDLEEDYQVCVRMLARTATGTSKKKSKA